MGELTEEQRKWLVGIGVRAAPPPPVWKPNLDIAKLSPEALDRVLKDSRAQAEAQLAQVNQALADVKAYIANLPSSEMGRSSYRALMKTIRERFPAAAGAAQWVKETASSVPAMKGKLPSPNALMNILESGVKSRGAEALWSMGTGKDMATLNIDRLLAAYEASLPSGVGVDFSGGVVQLTLTGAALKVQAAGGQVDASAGKAGTAVSFQHNDLSIEVKNDGWQAFDPKLRGQWQKLDDDRKTVVKLQADRDHAKAELETAKKGGATVNADLQVKFDTAEAEFNLAWKKLQEQITAKAQVSKDKISASVRYLKKDKDDKEVESAGISAEADLKTFEAKVEAFKKTPTLELAAAVTASAEKVTAKLELKAVKTGTVVTAEFEKALDETQLKIQALLNKGQTTVAVELKKKADELSAKVQVVHQHKDLKLAAELEKTLKDIRGSVEVEYKKGAVAVKGGASGSSTGEVAGKVQVDIALDKGRGFAGGNEKLSFAASVSNAGYRFEVKFSIGEPVETASLNELFGTADRQIKELYQLAGDKGVRSIAQVEELNQKFKDVMAPIDAAAKKAKTLKGKSEISASFGIAVQGDWPAGGKVSPPVVTVGVTIHF